MCEKFSTYLRYSKPRLKSSHVVSCRVVMCVGRESAFVWFSLSLSLSASFSLTLARCITLIAFLSVYALLVGVAEGRKTR